jgi:hypothetical protein
MVRQTVSAKPSKDTDSQGGNKHLFHNFPSCRAIFEYMADAIGIVAALS